ncbi:MAG: AbiH family protein [Lachnospiraceae bacterium]
MADKRERILYIIGNGFDRCHGLDTSTERFKEILRRQEIYNENDTAQEVFECYGVLWGDYESCLANIDLEAIEENQMIAPDYMSDHEYDRDGGIFNMEQYTESLYQAVQKSLEIMVDNANQMLAEIKPPLRNFLTIGDAVINFNYTSTLEELYNIPENIRVYHIHGFRKNGEKLLIGYNHGMSAEEYDNKYFDKDAIEKLQMQIRELESNETLTDNDRRDELIYWNSCYDELTSDRDYYVDKQREMVFQFYQSLKKEIQIDRLARLIKECGKIDEIIVMGHSMSDVDGDYMELIEQLVNPLEWRISQFENSPSQEDVREYSFAKKIQFYDLLKEFSSEII